MDDTYIIPITKLRKNAAMVIRDVNTTGVSAVIMQRSKPTAVIADYDYFMSLEETVMDMIDAADIEKRKNEPKIPFAEYDKKRWGNKRK